jgi:membrane protein DedA with SNARE-associated domain
VGWKKLWVLFTVIWVVVTGLNAFTILAFSDEQQQKALQPLILLVAVPAVLYALGCAWDWVRRKKKIGA